MAGGSDHPEKKADAAGESSRNKRARKQEEGNNSSHNVVNTQPATPPRPATVIIATPAPTDGARSAATTPVRSATPARTTAAAATPSRSATPKRTAATPSRSSAGAPSSSNAPTPRRAATGGASSSSGAGRGKSSSGALTIVDPKGRVPVAAADPPHPPAPRGPPAAEGEPLLIQCPLCSRVFNSYPAMFGHQRVHGDRPYRGAYPPPTFDREGTPSPPNKQEIEEEARNGAQMLLEMARGHFGVRREGPSGHDGGEASSSAARGLGVDLNIPVEPAADDEEEEKEDKGKGKQHFDLNKLPPPEE